MGVFAYHLVRKQDIPMPTRRRFIAKTSTGAVALAFPYLKLAPKTFASSSGSGPATFRYTPHEEPLPLPGRLQPQPVSQFGANDVRRQFAGDYAPGTAFTSMPRTKPSAGAVQPWVYHGIAPEYHESKFQTLRAKEVHYAVSMKESTHQWVPGVETPAYSYGGGVPGNTLRLRVGTPAVVRLTNEIDVETSLHLHGGHNPAHSDGHPCFYVFPGRTRDYFYPNQLPLHDNGNPDTSHAPSTLWYHDHGNDVTSHNVIMGLAGFCLVTDQVEEDLIAANVLPDVDAVRGDPYSAQGPCDLPLALIDQALNADGSLHWDPFDFDGRLGNLPTVNGKVQPYHRVKPRKYRLRLLGSSLARVYELRVVCGSETLPLLQIANDAFLLPEAVQVGGVSLVPGKRADVIVDFSRFRGRTVYLQNIMQQSNGRKPDGIDASKPTNLLKFIVADEAPPATDISVSAGTPLRPHIPIDARNVRVTREFITNRSNGAWQINSRFWSPARADAFPLSGSVERWIVRNSSGGWWHPFHVHLEGHQILKINGAPPRKVWSYLGDTAPLGENMEIEMLMEFRSYRGPFVFHCHNNNHEDMRMMSQFEVVGSGPGGRALPGTLNGSGFSVSPEVCGIPEWDIKEHPHLFT